MPRRCLHGVHPECALIENLYLGLCLGAACTGCIDIRERMGAQDAIFASALPALGASAKADKLRHTIL